MKNHDEMLDLVCCPENRSRLTRVDSGLLARLNDAIREGRVCNRAGRSVERILDDAFVREDGVWVYPVLDQIPVLLQGEAISLAAFTGDPS